MLKILPVFAAVLLFTVGARAHDTGKKPHVHQNGPYRIHVITIGPGEELFTRFGHIAMMVENTATNEKRVYNFGTFTFDDPELRIKYARGFLNYWLSVASFDLFFSYYAEMNRDVWLQTLNLSEAQAKDVAHRLEINSLPENRYYAYRHYLDNCCTRIRDVIDDVTDGAISKKFKKQSVPRDFRYWTATALDGLPIYKSVILYSLGPAIDKPLTRWDEEFLPAVLLEDLDKVTLGKSGVPLVASKRLLVERHGSPIGAQVPTIDIVVLMVLGLLMVVGFGAPLIVGNKKWSRRCLGAGLVLWGLLAGLGGLMLLAYWTLTTHYDTHYNENLLVNPFLHMWLIGPGVMLLFRARLGGRTVKFMRWYLLGALALISVDILLKIGPFIQGNWAPIVLAIALNTAAFFGLQRTEIE
ncbi:MAG: DUF4105 domain-containing protein [Deltaproteobacteria bacterium]|nr:DUF4105 domain-containing protein [Deltaproteobacteria bacterium]MBN2674298.1 DUF4105 domain-containing protein [Deltaproteobacteria bacterium]